MVLWVMVRSSPGADQAETRRGLWGNALLGWDLAGRLDTLPEECGTEGAGVVAMSSDGVEQGGVAGGWLEEGSILRPHSALEFCLLYTSDAADEEDSVDLGGRGIIKKKKMAYE
eukprot:TRINITY_DN23196_c0_g1_i1.p2 TRINITY_DN23196_c0_g1~~TRINITY_DN23196_c0_g1_i1.p2  ORF type:complete len:114 (-),score=28.15 TRINITY_DN23196_c0_g1_i1:73-414(-)